ncbi:MAG: CsbD family protein [Sphingomonas sp.]
MNQDQIEGTATDVTGKVKETLGQATGDAQTQNAGLADQISGKVQKTFGDTKETVARNAAPLADKARKFANERPFAAAALAGVVGLAILNTLRGKTA